MANSIFINTGGSSSGGGGGTLPTAPKGQVLISQGDGIPPIFSNKPILYAPGGPVDQRTWRLSTENDGNFHLRLLDDAGNPGNPRITIDPYSGGLSSVVGGMGALNGSIQTKYYMFMTFLFSQLAPSGAQNTVGNMVNISDSTVNTPGSIIAGGGTFNVLARWNGTNWKVVA